MGKKNRKPKKEKKVPEYRSKEERQAEVKHILEQLSEFQLNPTYEPVKKLYLKFQEYIREGERLLVNIPFPEINRRIKGVLAINKPRAIKRIITNGTKQHLRCFEIVSGSPLTEKEINAEKKSQQNSHCPDIANPNRMQ